MVKDLFLGACPCDKSTFRISSSLSSPRQVPPAVIKIRPFSIRALKLPPLATTRRKLYSFLPILIISFLNCFSLNIPTNLTTSQTWHFSVFTYVGRQATGKAGGRSVSLGLAYIAKFYYSNLNIIYITLIMSSAFVPAKIVTSLGDASLP